MWLLELIFTIIFEYLIIEIIGGILKYIGAFVMSLLGGFKNPIKHYTENEDYHIQPYLFGIGSIIIISCLIGKLI